MVLPDVRPPQEEDAAWLAAFHRGDPEVLDRCYRQHFDAVDRAVVGLLGAADRETVIHEVFSRLIGGADLRASFRGGSLRAWLATLARNQAIDFRRRLGREVAAPAREAAGGEDWEEAAQARLLVERFRRERLPAEWASVFELRFLQQLSQREAARALGIRRTTLAYRELRIRHLLQRFLLRDDQP